jgi:ankyrin repeat protein
LHYASCDGHKEIAELLITKGADVNAKDKHGRTTPLDSAIFARKTETADLLRKHGGKTGEELKAAGKPTETVAEAAKVEPVAEATQPEPPTAKAPDISIQEAAKEGNIAAIKQHLAAGTDVNAKGRDGWTPLHNVARNGHKEIVELLIAKGAEVNAKDEDGWTPLHWAAVNGHEETVELLLANGSDVNAKDNDGETPLDWADGEIANLLRKNGGKIGEELKAEGK